MAPPSPLAIATSSLQRLVKEEASYYKELEKQEARLKKVEESTEEDENREYTLKQEVSPSQSTTFHHTFLPCSILKIPSLVNKDSYT
jgi:tubulin-specific chaperone A